MTSVQKKVMQKNYTSLIEKRYREGRKTIRGLAVSPKSKTTARNVLLQLKERLSIENFTVFIETSDIVFRFLENRGQLSPAPDVIDIIVRDERFKFRHKFGLGPYGVLDHFSPVGTETVRNITTPLFEKMLSRRNSAPFSPR